MDLEQTVAKLLEVVMEVKNRVTSVESTTVRLEKAANAFIEMQRTQAACSAKQEERWTAHRDIHTKLNGEIKEAAAEIKAAASNAVENRVQIAKILAASGGGGILGGAIILGITEIAKRFL